MQIHLSEKQQLAIKLYRELGTDGAVARAMRISRPSANRLRRRGEEALRRLHLIKAVGGDPIDAIEAVKRVLDV